MEYSSFHMTQHDQHLKSPKIQSTNGVVQLPDDCPDTKRELATNARVVVNNFRKEPRTCGRRARQHHTKTSRFHETRRNAVGGTQRCGQYRRHFARGRDHAPPPALFPFPRPRPRPLSALTRPAPSATGASTLPPAAAGPPEFHARPRKRR